MRRRRRHTGRGVSKVIASRPALLSLKPEAETRKVDIETRLDQYKMLLKFPPFCMFVCIR